jgi:hypothetical protein
MEFLEGQCLQVNEVTLDKACQVVGGFDQKVGITLTANTTLASLRWRSAAVNKDIVTPDEGRLEPSGTQTIDLTARVKSQALYVEFTDDKGRVRMILRVKHKE